MKELLRKGRLSSYNKYSIMFHETGTYTYEDDVLTVKNANGVEVTAEGDPLKLHYVSGVSDQLTADFTIPADALAG